jgi:hypothetical protein
MVVGCDLELNRWQFLQDHFLSDHPYIFFYLAKTLPSPTRPSKLKPPRADDIEIDRFNKILPEELTVFDTIQEVLSSPDRIFCLEQGFYPSFQDWSMPL